MTRDLTLHDEVEQLRQTFIAMRNEVEAARAGQNEAVLNATSAGHAEITELRATIQSAAGRAGE